MNNKVFMLESVDSKINYIYITSIIMLWILETSRTNNTIKHLLACGIQLFNGLIISDTQVYNIIFSILSKPPLYRSTSVK